MRIVIIGNSGGGKSTLARALGNDLGLEVIEIDRFLWQSGWEPVSDAQYDAAHTAAISGEAWVLEGVGHLASIPHRLRRATHLIFADFPLWQHFWLAAERELSWARRESTTVQGGRTAPPPTRRMFETIWELEQSWMPDIRGWVDQAERQGSHVLRLKNADAVNLSDVLSFCKTNDG